MASLTVSSVQAYFSERMQRLTRPNQKMYTRDDTLEMLTTLLAQKLVLPIQSSVDAMASILAKPIGSDEMIQRLSVLGEGSFGKTFLCKVQINQQNLKDREIVVKRGIADDDSTLIYRNMLYEIFVNHFIIKPAVFSSYYSIPNFPVLYSFLICKQSSTKTPQHSAFCEAPIHLENARPRRLDRELREGRAHMFPIFEKVSGLTMRNFLKSKHHLSVSELKGILSQIWLALDSLNRSPHFYSHNDLHTSNVMISSTTLPSYEYLCSDARIRRVPTNGHRVVIIDQGMACGATTDMVTLYSRPYCPPLDIFRLMMSVYEKILASRKLRKLRNPFRKIFVSMFGNEVDEFVDDPNSTNFFHYAVFLSKRGKEWHKMANLSYLDAFEKTR